jgi:hypothetical protein
VHEREKKNFADAGWETILKERENGGVEAKIKENIFETFQVRKRNCAQDGGIY